MPRINPTRLITKLRQLAKIGAYKTGVHRPTYSAADMEGRHWLVDQYRNIGLEAHIDGVGNVFGRSSKPGPVLLVGSHLESQNYAGWLDGALGVVYGLEIATAFSEDPAGEGIAIDPVAWADEEGHFVGCLGSRSFIDDVTEEEIDLGRSPYTGQLLREALDQAGLSHKPRDLIQPDRYAGYLEAHIEQGDSLEASGQRLGIVTSIVGVRQFRIRIEGVQNHAGSTRMAARKDAGMAGARLASALEESLPQVAGPRSVWTMGALTLEPGAASVISGRATMLFQIRDADIATLKRMEEAVRDFARQISDATGCTLTVELLACVEPLHMEAGFQAAIEAAAEVHAPGRHVRMPSGAAHDAQVVGRHVPSAMLFVPSVGGVSHHWTEDTNEADIVLGCQVLADAAHRILIDRKQDQDVWR